MPDLPHGWRMRNSGGELVGPPLEKDDVGSDGSEGSEASEQLNIQPDSDGWEDLEDDTEAVSIKCLLCTDVFPAARPMLEHTKEDHSLDFLAVRAERELDFYGTIKLANYIRSEFSNGNSKPNVSDPALWADDKYLQPAMEDDALLFSLDDLGDSPVTGDKPSHDGAESTIVNGG